MPLLDGDTSFATELSFHQSTISTLSKPSRTRRYGLGHHGEKTPLLLPVTNSPITETSPPPSFWTRFTGLFLALLATFIYSLATLILKLFSHYHPFTVSIWRFQGMIIPSIPVILAHMYCGKRKSDPITHRRHDSVFGSILPLSDPKNLRALGLIAVRSIVGCTSTVLQIYAVDRLNLADASVIVFSSPVFVTLIAHVVLKERAGWFSLVTALFTFAGVVIIARPPILTGGTPMDADTLAGVGFALGSMLLATVVYVILRYLREVHYSVVTISYGVLGSIECIVLAAYMNVLMLPSGAHEWALAIGLIMFTFLGQTFLILALKFEQAGPVALLQSTDVIFSFLLQYIFLGVHPDIYSLSGAFIVICGVVLITLRKWITTLPEEHPTRLRFSCCLV